MSRSLSRRELRPHTRQQQPEGRTTFTEVYNHFNSRFQGLSRTVKENHNNLDERLARIEKLVDEHEQNLETQLRDLSLTDTNVSKLWRICQTLTGNQEQTELEVTDAHKKLWRLNDSVDCRFEVLEKTVSDIQDSNTFSTNFSEIELTQLRKRKRKDESLFSKPKQD